MRRSRLGLSYLEMMISLALLGIMAGLIAGTLDFGRRAWEQTDGLSLIAETALARADVRDWFSWATFRDHPALPRAFEGRPDGFDYAGAVARDGFDAIDRMTAELAIAPSERGQNLTWRFAAQGADDAQIEIHVEVGSALRGVRVQYYGLRYLGEDPAWHDLWPRDARVPRLIKITAERSDGRAWPPLVIVPRKALVQRRISVSSPLPPG